LAPAKNQRFPNVWEKAAALPVCPVKPVLAWWLCPCMLVSGPICTLTGVLIHVQHSN